MGMKVKIPPIVFRRRIHIFHLSRFTIDNRLPRFSFFHNFGRCLRKSAADEGADHGENQNMRKLKIPFDVVSILHREGAGEH